MKAIAQTSLYYLEGSSNKEYHAEIVSIAEGNVVNFRYGRRGGALTTGTKTAKPVDFALAKKIYDKLVKEKTSKGYTPDISGTSYQGTENAGLKTGFMPQLLNPINKQEVIRLIEDDRWIAQEKMDGERRAAHADTSCVMGINRRGLSVSLPQPIANELQSIAARTGEILVDGEIIGNILHVFDLHIYKGQRIHTQSFLERMRLATESLVGCNFLKVVPVAITTDQKRDLWNRVQLAHGEGLVFKLKDSQVIPGRPSTGGDWLKFKFTASASCVVMQVNSGKRSVKLGLLDIEPFDSNSNPWLSVGNVTIPQNHDVPATGDIVEVEYLYAYQGGSLFQPVYRGKRTDLNTNACILGQLKFKPEGLEDDDA